MSKPQRPRLFMPVPRLGVWESRVSEFELRTMFKWRELNGDDGLSAFRAGLSG